MLLVGNHSGGNLTPDTIVFTLAFTTYFGVERALPPARPQPRALAARAVVPAQVRHRRRVARRTRARRWRRAPPCSSTPAATTRSTARAGSATASTSAAARASSGWRSSRTCRSCPVVGDRRPGDRAVPLARRAPGASCSRLDRLFRLKVLPISLALPWGLNVGDMLGHIPLPAKITVEALPPIDLRERVRRRARRRRGLRAPRAADAGDARRAGRRAALPGDRMRVAEHDRRRRAARARLGARLRPGARAATSWPASRAGRSSATQRTGLGARYRMLLRVGSAEVGGLIEVVEFARDARPGVDLDHRHRPARPLAPARRRGRPHAASSCGSRTASPAAGICGWLAERVAAPTVRGHLRRTLQQLKRPVEHEQLALPLRAPPLAMGAAAPAWAPPGRRASDGFPARAGSLVVTPRLEADHAEEREDLGRRAHRHRLADGGARHAGGGDGAEHDPRSTSAPRSSSWSGRSTPTTSASPCC